MVTGTTPRGQTAAGLSTHHGTEGSYIDWAAIIAGGVLALAISFLLISFGASLGLSLTSPYRGEGVSAAWLGIAAGIWFAWVTVSSFGAGGYIAGRMRRRAGDATADEVSLRDGAHGLMVWATGALVSIILTAPGVGGLLSAGASAVGTAADTATDAISADYFANVMLRGGQVQPPPEDGAAAAGEDGETTAPTLQPAGEAEDVSGVNPDVQQEIASIIARSVTEGGMAERDRDYLAQLVAANTNLDRQQALTRVDEITAEVDDARAAALEVVDDARVAGVVFGFIAAATLLIGAVAAFFAAAAGGRHRDEGLGLDVLMVRR